MIRRVSVMLLLAGAVAATGCAMCQNKMDHVANYYGGHVGEWNSEHARLGSVYAGTAMVTGEMPDGTPSVEPLPEPENDWEELLPPTLDSSYYRR